MSTGPSRQRLHQQHRSVPSRKLRYAAVLLLAVATAVLVALALQAA